MDKRLAQTLEIANLASQAIADDPDLASFHLKKASSLFPDDPYILFNLGIALHQRGMVSSAIRAYEKSLSLPGTPAEEIYTNLSQDLLLSGDFKRGLDMYEKRLQKPKYDYTYFSQRLGEPWQGFLDKRKPSKLILVGEQGFGDTIQFSKFGLELQEYGLDVILFIQPALVQMMRSCSAFSHVCSKLNDELLTEGTCWIPLLSVPHRLVISKSTAIMRQRYLKPPIDVVTSWGEKLNRRPGKRLVGLHWQGNLKHEESLYTRGRSFSAMEFLGLKDLRETEFVSVQKGPGSCELDNIIQELEFVRGQHLVSSNLNFLDTAAVLANCDALVTSDSAVIHLAGSIGIETFGLLKKIPEWRWGLAGEDCNWYANVRLYRQQESGDWADVVKRVRYSLQTLFSR